MPGVVTTHIRKVKAMRIMCLALLLMASMAFVLMGCSDNSNSLVTPNDQTIAASSSGASLAKGKPIVHSATGASNEFFGGKMQSWAFNAKQYADGTCDGVVQIVVHSQPRDYGFLHCNVLSLKVWEMGDGAKAAVIGMVEVEKGPYNGSYDAFVVYDYGEGSKAHPDMFTTVICWDPDNSLENMREVWNMPPDQVIQKILDIHPGLTWNDVLVPVDEGNVQVR
jgi:hypothetical protein